MAEADDEVFIGRWDRYRVQSIVRSRKGRLDEQSRGQLSERALLSLVANDDLSFDVRMGMWQREARRRMTAVELEWWIKVLAEIHRIQERRPR